MESNIISILRFTPKADTLFRIHVLPVLLFENLSAEFVYDNSIKQVKENIIRSKRFMW